MKYKELYTKSCIDRDNIITDFNKQVVELNNRISVVEQENFSITNRWATEKAYWERQMKALEKSLDEARESEKYAHAQLTEFRNQYTSMRNKAANPMHNETILKGEHKKELDNLKTTHGRAMAELKRQLQGEQEVNKAQKVENMLLLAEIVRLRDTIAEGLKPAEQAVSRYDV